MQTNASRRYEAVKALGSHAHGFRQMCRDLSDASGSENVVCIDYFRRGRVDCNQILGAINDILPLSSCEQCVQFREVFLTPHYLGVVTEHVKGGDLSAFIQKHGGSLAEPLAMNLFHQLVVGVDFIHSCYKAHRNLQLSSLLVVEGPVGLPKLKLAAFEHTSSTSSAAAPLAGSALFTPPEIFLKSVNPDNSSLHQGEAIDTWACGVILFIMRYGHHPFMPRDSDQSNQASAVTMMIENSVRGSIQFPAYVDATDLLVDLLRRVLVPAPHKRLTIKQILSHPWLKDAKQPPSPIRQLQSRDLIHLIVKEAERVMDPHSVQATGQTFDASSGSSGDAVEGSYASGLQNPLQKKSFSSKPPEGDADQFQVPARPPLGPLPPAGLEQSGQRVIYPAADLLPAPPMQATGPLQYLCPKQLGRQLQEQSFTIPILTTGMNGPYSIPNPQPYLAQMTGLPQQLLLQEEINLLQTQLRIKQLTAAIHMQQMEREGLVQHSTLTQPNPAANHDVANRPLYYSHSTPTL